MANLKLALLNILIVLSHFCIGQEVEILSTSVNTSGQVQLAIEGKADHYYLLKAVHEPNNAYESTTSITLGQDGIMTISEPLASFPYENYTITEHPIAIPLDTDGDGIDDISELSDMPSLAPLNYAEQIPFNDGSASIPDRETFTALGVISANIPWAPFLNDQEFVKFAIVAQETARPRVFFINSKTHDIHAEFLATINTSGSSITTGEVVYNPNTLLPNGSQGSYSFNYSFGDVEDFETTRRTFELLAANMPFLENNFQHFISQSSENEYLNNFADDYIGSRIGVVLESEFFQDVDYIPFNQAEGYGFFRVMEPGDNPGSRDIVLYDALPNTLPRVGGIITSVVQTPLSHVNLRAIQDNLPNAYIKNPLENPLINDLVGKYIYYKVAQEEYIIREATLEEVNAWYENIRPTQEQTPDRDLSITAILPLDEIEFEMSTAFGAKCANVATMRKFGFPEGTIPNGFGVPFYYYDEFMKFNGFYEEVETMINNPDFIADLEVRIDMLKDFRKEIKDAPMPQWMLDDLQAMHDAFPEGTAVRVRSSTNNEDLPGFSGAGLYTSKTQHLDEGHISKSVKQVYASMWNFRAYDERDFYRVDQYIAAMGLLCHPNYQEEKSNGVGVSIDPLYGTDETYYINTQIGEFLITNPDANAIAEEILISEDPEQGYTVLRYSNLLPNGQLVMEENDLDSLRDQLRVIHDEFAILYNVVGAEGFGMDIEYKITAQDQLIIKQARPWVSFWANIKANIDLAVSEITEPQSASTLGESELITAKVANVGLREIQDFDLSLIIDQEVVETISVDAPLQPFSDSEYQFSLPQDFSEKGDYNVSVAVTHPQDGYDRNDTLVSIIRNLYSIEGELVSELSAINCGSEVIAKATLTNEGEDTITTADIEVVVNGNVTGVSTHTLSIDYLEQEELFISITDNLVEGENTIALNILTINDEPDAISDNNTSGFTANVVTDEVTQATLTINTDNYPEETTWEVYNDSGDILIASGGNYEDASSTYTESICVTKGECYKLFVYDSYSDGICCSFGEGNFFITNSEGEEIVSNNGDFGAEAEEIFCIEGLVNTVDQTLSDNAITIYPNPTQGLFTVEIIDGLSSADDLNIEVYNCLGELIKRSQLKNSEGEKVVVLSLEGFVEGTYVARCYNQTIDKNFKLIKL